jgi:hypothetical protein
VAAGRRRSPLAGDPANDASGADASAAHFLGEGLSATVFSTNEPTKRQNDKKDTRQKETKKDKKTKRKKTKRTPTLIAK